MTAILTGDCFIVIYQKIYTGERPYNIGVGALPEFPAHRHADFEFNFCIEGEFDVVIDKRAYHASKGAITVIPSMCAHEFPKQKSANRVLTLIVGTTFLQNSFGELSQILSSPDVLNLNTEKGTRLRDLFFECTEAFPPKSISDSLVLSGNVYKILAYLIDELSDGESSDGKRADLRRVENIEKALETIYYSYKEPLSIEYVARLTGYSKSNFCKIFKSVVGETFHQALNRQRVNSAAGLLSVTDMSVSDISAEVGFSEPKAFCRVFKSIYGVTPGQYRKMK